MSGKDVVAILMFLGLAMLIVGIVISLAMENCYKKTPQEFFESYCKELIKNG